MNKFKKLSMASRKKNFSNRVYNLFNKISRGFQENYSENSLNSSLIANQLNPIILYFIIPIMIKLITLSEPVSESKKNLILKELQNMGFDISQAQILLSDNISNIDNYEIYIKKIKLICNDSNPIYIKIISALINIATYNKPLLSIELSIIKHIAHLFNISYDMLDKLISNALSISQERDPYLELEIDRNSSQEELKSQYRILVKKYHPDKFSQNKNISNEYKKSMENKFHAINKAYNKLKNN
jgi:DnaJ like chaperone protein